MRIRVLLMLCLAIPLGGAEEFRPPNISGQWHHGVNRSPEYLAIVSQQGKKVSVTYVIHDRKSGAQFVYARARGYFTSFWNIYLWGKHVRSHNYTRKGQRFTARWLLFDKNRRIAEVSYWNVYRIKSYWSKALLP